MERSIYKELIAWKNSKKRKPLILEGARQVGKTWILKEFRKKEYSKLAYVNDLQDKPEGLDVSVLSTDSVSGLPVAPHPYG